MRQENLKKAKNSSYSQSVSNLIEPFKEKTLFAVKDIDGETISITGNDLLQQTKVLGSGLQCQLKSQQKVILIFPQGLDYIHGLMACWYANLVAIPIPLTDLTQPEELVKTIIKIVKDSDASLILTNAKITQSIKEFSSLEDLPVVDIVSFRQFSAKPKKERDKKSKEIAIVLYSSGSNSEPKGITISHQSVMLQAHAGAKQWQMNSESCIVSWMPQFHNFGLHFNILAPLVKGAFSVLLEPNSFLNNPNYWFDSILEHRATHTAAPNFAFDYCVNKVNTNIYESTNQLPLASIQAIVCGGEPINKHSYEKFIHKFSCLGLIAKSICSHYGLSEVGSVVTSSTEIEEQFKFLDRESLGRNLVKYCDGDKKSKTVASCGKVGSDIAIAIVNPATHNQCSEGSVGEIWIDSSSAASGYMNKDRETVSTFSAKLSDTSDKRSYLRTGDLGFIESGHLYVVGREKDLIIINGKNHHPIDIEWSIKKNLSYLDLARVVFSQEIEDQEKVIVVQEIPNGYKVAEQNKVINDIRDAVARNHSISAHEIYLVCETSIPRTGSGKIKKQACRDLHKSGDLSFVQQYITESFYMQENVQQATENVEREIASIIQDLKTEVFSAELGVPKSSLDNINEFSHIMLNSIQYVTVSKKIETVFKFEFAPVMLFKYPSFTKLASYILEQADSSHVKDDKPEQSKFATQEGTSYQHQQVFECSDKGIFDEPANKSDDKSIAIIGMTGEFPGGAANTDIFWENLVSQTNCITPIPTGRKEFSRLAKKSGEDSECQFPNWGGFIDGVDTFDADFFGVSPTEANSMDPQQRKVLEMTWNVLECGGYNPKGLKSQRVGLFIGAHNNDYLELILARPDMSQQYGGYLDSGVHMSMIANRVSRWFDFKGPSEVINTACSSSLVAVHHAVESIVKGSTDIAIAGGINLILSPRIYKAAHSAGMLSSDGACKSFDQGANGFVRAEGYGAVLLKSYRQAMIDNDSIYAVIKSAVVNHDGKSDSLRAPNLESQTKLLKTAYLSAGLAPDSISYIETHGTGTPLGDPIEIEALKEAFKELGKDLPSQYCGLGSVKSNIGHCESAAGIAGLIKIVLSMEKKFLPGTLHFSRLNDSIVLENSPFYIVDKNQEWKRLQSDNGELLPLRAGISSFGFGGVNSHIVLEEPYGDVNQDKRIITNGKQEKKQKYLILLSAKSDAQLRRLAHNLYLFLVKLPTEKDKERNRQEVNQLRDIAYTLQVGRHAMDERFAMVVETKLELQKMLDEFLDNKPTQKNCYRDSTHKDLEHKHLLTTDEGLKVVVRNWLKLKELNKLASFWVKGLEPDWQTMHVSEMPRRIKLPTYPFTKKRYWLPDCRQDKCEMSTALNLQESTSNLVRDKEDESSQVRVRESLVDSMSNKYDEGEIVEFVKAVVADNTGQSVDEITPSQELGDLGVDSIVRLALADEIIKQFSELSLEPNELLLLPNVIEIVTVIQEKAEKLKVEQLKVEKELQLETENGEFDVGNSEKLADLCKSIKHEPDNIVIEEVSVSEKIANTLEARTVVTKTHPFFNDHSLDHITGVQLIESMTQLIKVYELYSAEKGDCLVTSLKAKFSAFCENESADVICTKKGLDRTKRSKIYKVSVLQNQETICETRIGIQNSLSNVPHIGPTNETSLSSRIARCESNMVNKRHKDNVFISSPCSSWNTSGCWFFPERSRTIFNDSSEGYIDVTQLIEACRQHERALTKRSFFQNSDTQATADASKQQTVSAKDSIGVLKSLEINLSRALWVDEEVFITNGDMNVLDVGKNRVINWQSELLINGIVVGIFKMEALLLSSELYDSWRAIESSEIES